MVNVRDGRSLIAVGVGSGAAARTLHHALSDMEAVSRTPDYVGAFLGGHEAVARFNRTIGLQQDERRNGLFGN